MNIGRRLLGWSVAVAMLLLRITCRTRLHGDPRPELRASGSKYVYAVLHAHQVAAAIKREPNTAAMVSRSTDGEMLIPAFRALGITSVRGSNRRSQGDRGGRAALDELVRHVATGNPALLAVDGPRGPRSHVRKGIAVLSHRSGAAVVNVVIIPSRRWILSRSWDRLQIPYPFSRLDAYFAEPLTMGEGESIEQFRSRIEASLQQLESAVDPTEAAYHGTDSRRARPTAA